jgi:class 3 adenylate cyclase
MTDHVRRWDGPDELVEFGGVTQQLISIGGLTVSREVQPPGWSWRDDFQPLVGGDWCEAHHVGIQLEGRQAIALNDGTTFEIGPGELYDIPPGHEGWTVGDEPCVMMEWSGMRRWVDGAGRQRSLVTLLFTDIVDSTRAASELGDDRWHDLLTVHYQQAGDAIDRFGGRRVATTGDGVLATFDATAAGVRCAVALRELAERQGLRVRTGVHVGEVERAGEDVRGLSVHAAARVMAAAGPGEVFVTEPTRLLCQGAGLTFEDAGERELKGVSEPWRLYRVLP